MYIFCLLIIYLQSQNTTCQEMKQENKLLYVFCLGKSVPQLKKGCLSIYGCAVSRLYVDSTTTTSCVTHSMLIGIETYSEVKLC